MKRRKSLMFIMWMMIFLAGVMMHTSAVQAEQANPRIERITINKKVVKPGQTFRIEMKISNDRQIRKLQAVYGGYFTSKQRFVKLSYNAARDSWTGSIKVSKRMPGGLYRLFGIEITLKNYDKITYENSRILLENAEEQTVIRKNLNSYDFRVRGTKPDRKPPVIHGSAVKVSKTVARPGEKVKYSIKCSDSSGIAFAGVLLGYHSDDGKEDEDIVFLRYRKKTKVCEGGHRISKLYEKGVWRIKGVVLVDNMGNYAFYGNSDNVNEPGIETLPLTHTDVKIVS